MLSDPVCVWTSSVRMHAHVGIWHVCIGPGPGACVRAFGSSGHGFRCVGPALYEVVGAGAGMGVWGSSAWGASLWAREQAQHVGSRAYERAGVHPPYKTSSVQMAPGP